MISITEMELQNIYLQVRDFLIWASECERTARSDHVGWDYDHIRSLQFEFHQFALRTVAHGNQWGWSICDQCDALLISNHPESCTISTWRDDVSEAWENLLELIDTRIQVLEANYIWHLFMRDCRIALAGIVAKIQQWSTTILASETTSNHVNDLAKLKANDRMRSDLANLKPLIKNVKMEYNAMYRCYSGDQLAEIKDRASDVAICWHQLKSICRQHSSSGQSGPETQELLIFLNKYGALKRLIDDVQVKLMGWPKEIGSTKELDNFMKDHQSLKQLIASREELLEDCTNFGSRLISQRHYAATDVEDKLLVLNKDWVHLLHLWEQRFENVQKVLLKTARSLDNLHTTSSPKPGPRIQHEPPGVSSTKSDIAQAQSAANKKFYGGLYTSLPNVVLQDEWQKSNDATTCRNSTYLYEDVSAVSANDSIAYEGILFRKRLRQRHDRIAVESGWKRYYCILRNGRLIFFDDKVQKEKGKPSKTAPPLVLRDANVKTDAKHGRLRYLFIVEFPNNVEYLFQARNDYHLNHWVKFVTRATQAPADINSNGLKIMDDASLNSSKTKRFLKRASPRLFNRFFDQKKQLET